jgi:hypothetical protein
MTHSRKRTSMPPKRSAEEYEREIATLRLALSETRALLIEAWRGGEGEASTVIDAVIAELPADDEASK